MALDFPNTPIDGQEWTDPSNGVTYVYSSATNSWYVLGGPSGTGVASVTVTAPITDIGTASDKKYALP